MRSPLSYRFYHASACGCMHELQDRYDPRARDLIDREREERRIFERDQGERYQTDRDGGSHLFRRRIARCHSGYLRASRPFTDPVQCQNAAKGKGSNAFCKRLSLPEAIEL